MHQTHQLHVSSSDFLMSLRITKNLKKNIYTFDVSCLHKRFICYAAKTVEQSGWQRISKNLLKMELLY